MPLIDDGLKGKKVFKPKKYRPWDLLDELPKSKTDDAALSKISTFNTHYPDDAFTSKTKTPINLGQIEDKPETKPRTNLGQTEDKLKTNTIQTEDKPETELRTKHKTNLGQIEDKPETKPRTNLGQNKKQFSFYSISGLQKKITMLIYNCCKTSRDKVTMPISTEHLAISCYSSKSSVRKTIQRLEKKGVISRMEFKNGRGGWTRYGIENDVYQEILHNETEDNLRTKLGQSGDKPETELRTELRTIALSSNNNDLNNKTITTGDLENVTLGKEDLPIEWKNINCEPLRHIGFSETQLLQLYSRKLNVPNVIQESINHFAFGLENSEKTKAYKEPLYVLMGILRKGQEWTETNYESATDRALRQLFERKKQENEKRGNLYKQFFELEYNKWFRAISDEQLKELMPKLDFRFGRYTSEIENQAKALFRQTEWEVVLEEIKKQIEK